MAAAEPMRGRPRLQAAYDLLDATAQPIVDCGFDHGQLLRALRRESGRQAFGVDRVPALVQQARQQGQSSAWVGDGCAAVRPGSVAQVVIAGLGCRTMARLLTQPALQAAQAVIVVPHTQPFELLQRYRRHGRSNVVSWLKRNGAGGSHCAWCHRELSR